ncbi:MAG: hypothetical protein ACE364_07005 [Chlorobiota bacterium]
MKKTLIIISVIFLLGLSILGYKIYSGFNDLFDTFHSEHNLNDSSFVLITSEISPDHEFRYYEYQFDNGGLGYSRVFWSVIRNDSLSTDLDKGLLPDGYKAVGWTENSRLLVESWTPYYYKEDEIILNNKDTINGVLIELLM